MLCVLGLHVKSLNKRDVFREANKDDKKGNSKRKKKKTDHPAPHPSLYAPNNGVGFWAKNQNSPPLMSTQLLSPESLQGSPNSSTTYNQVQQFNTFCFNFY